MTILQNWIYRNDRMFALWRKDGLEGSRTAAGVHTADGHWISGRNMRYFSSFIQAPLMAGSAL
jgi:hypothetical protein